MTVTSAMYGNPRSGKRPTLIDRVRRTLRASHYSRRTEDSYIGWIKRYIIFHDMRHPVRLGHEEVRRFLTDLAMRHRVSASTQNQALNAILFLYKKVLNIELDWITGVVRAKRPKRLPVVLSRPEIKSILDRLHGTKWIMASLLYGAGLRLLECLRLRVKDLDFQRNQIFVHSGKGDKDRSTLFPRSLREPLKTHLSKVRALFECNLDHADFKTTLPTALNRKYPTAGREWGWQYVFPASRLCTDPDNGELRQHHLHESVLQRAVKDAVRSAGIPKHATCHTFRHSFATHLLESVYDIRTVQELMGHKDVRKTMVYTHVLNRGKLGVRSPVDSL